MKNPAVIFAGLVLGLAGFLVGPVAPEQKCVSGFCLPELYEKLENPGSVTNSTTTVHVETEIMDVLQVRHVHPGVSKIHPLMFFQVNDKEFSVTLTMYFAVRWEEPRLTTNITVRKSQLSNNWISRKARQNTQSGIEAFTYPSESIKVGHHFWEKQKGFVIPDRGEIDRTRTLTTDYWTRINIVIDTPDAASRSISVSPSELPSIHPASHAKGVHRHTGQSIMCITAITDANIQSIPADKLELRKSIKFSELGKLC